MKIRNNDELKLFEETLDRCEASVLVVTAQGEQYDLKDPAQRYIAPYLNYPINQIKRNTFRLESVSSTILHFSFFIFHSSFQSLPLPSPPTPA